MSKKATAEQPETPEVTQAGAADPETPPTPEPTLDESLASALDEGIAEATPPDVAGEGLGTIAAAAPQEPEAPAAPEATGDGEAPAAATTEAPAPSAPAAAAAASDAPEAAKPNEATEATEAEIKTLGLKEKSAERFRELANSANEYAPIKEALTKAGIEDPRAFVEQVPQLLQRSKDFDDLVGMVQDTGATPQQYDMALHYLGDVTKAMQGDVEAAKRGYQRAAAEMAAFGQMLGMEAPGVDPVAGHADLVRDVQSGALSRDRAVEIAQSRAQGQLTQRYQQQVAQRDQGAEAAAQAREALDQLGNTLKAADPDYARKEAMFVPMVRWIVQNRPPQQWAQAAQEAYATIPSLPAAPQALAAPAAPTPKPPPGPMRAGGPRPALQPTTDDPMEALDLGIAAATG